LPLLATGARVQVTLVGEPATVVIVPTLGIGAALVMLELPIAMSTVVLQLAAADTQSRLLGWNTVVATPAALVNAVTGEKL